MPLKATNDNILVIREDAASENKGIFIPDSAKNKMHKGKIVTVGKLVSDPIIKVGEVGIFNKSAGFEITEGGVNYLVLRQMDIVSIL